MSDSKTLPTFAELTGLPPEKLRQPATLKHLGTVADHCADALLRLRGRIEALEKKLSDMEAKR